MAFPAQQPYHTAPQMRRESSASSTITSSSSPPSPSWSSRPSSISSPSLSPLYSSLSPRVQLIPHTLSLGFDSILSPSERLALEKTSFDTLDLSSKDFDFDDIFTYDRPQQRFSRIVEVSSPIRANGASHAERDWSGFQFSNYANNHAVSGTTTTRERSRPPRPRGAISEMYLRNGKEARKR